MALARLTMFKSNSFVNESSTTFDNDFKFLLEAASDLAARFCGRFHEDTQANGFELVSYTELYDGTDTNKLYLRHTPVRSISELRLWDGDDSYDLEDADVYQLLNQKYIFYPRLGQSDNATWPNFKVQFTNGIEVTYVAGYDTTGWDKIAVTDQFDVPTDLEYAVAAIAHLSWKQGTKSGGRRGLLSKTVGPETLQVDKFVQGLPEDVITILNRYQRVFF